MHSLCNDNATRHLNETHSHKINFVPVTQWGSERVGI